MLKTIFLAICLTATRLPKGKHQGRSQQSLLNFLALGDTGTGEKEQYAVANAMNCYQQVNPVSLVLLTGDNRLVRKLATRSKPGFERS
ncbi:hypothetical protein NIES593_02340 [Hydrococcus rivularis NIES-593]|uniref:Uncharacterized protein n=1 Tax=Hydrococcus rivularis NIES-593 TaxID=1921803 RepID=A0A1U7HQY8_9CYAN|nr:hypothetical protein [Hydrococcus rivularis]OKH25945.1 hypothetical protein NIES593_02340 [Hydrococcus rivularis NIES-593]